MDLTQIIQSFVNDDQSWLGSAHGTTSTDTCTLDITKFDAGVFDFGDYTHKNVIPSGVVLAKITATGKYGPYAAAGLGGLAVPVGLLFHAVSVFQRTTSDKIGAIFWHGQVIRSKLPTVSGIDDAGVAALPHIQFV